MINVCANCGEYSVDKAVIIEENVAICPVCQHRNPFAFHPLFLVCGASGTGKSTVCQSMIREFQDVVILDGDILWNDSVSVSDYFNLCLRVSKNIAQSGRSVLLFSAGAIPDNIESCAEAIYFSEIHYLALVCDDEVLSERLRQRPSWRKSGNETFIQEQIGFNHWLKQNANTLPTLSLLDTTHISIDTACDAVKSWVSERI